MSAEYDDYDDGEMSSESILSKDGPRVLAEQCSTCIGRPGNLMDLRPGRVRQMVRDGCAGGGIACHQTLSHGGHPEFGGPAACRWFYDHYGHLCNLFRIWGRLGGFIEVETAQDNGDDEPGHGYHEAGDY